jgi:hypothetical protein
MMLKRGAKLGLPGALMIDRGDGEFTSGTPGIRLAAIDCHRQAAALTREIGDRFAEGDCLIRPGANLWRANRPRVSGPGASQVTVPGRPRGTRAESSAVKRV